MACLGNALFTIYKASAKLSWHFLSYTAYKGNGRAPLVELRSQGPASQHNRNYSSRATCKLRQVAPRNRSRDAGRRQAQARV
jgi:hypothetical protein